MNAILALALIVFPPVKHHADVKPGDHVLVDMIEMNTSRTDYSYDETLHFWSVVEVDRNDRPIYSYYGSHMVTYINMYAEYIPAPVPSIIQNDPIPQVGDDGKWHWTSPSGIQVTAEELVITEGESLYGPMQKKFPMRFHHKAIQW